MRFNSKSILLHKGHQTSIPITIPIGLRSYHISSDIWENAIKTFNLKLNSRSLVNEIIDGVQVDILKLDIILNNIFLKTVIKEDNIEHIKQNNFTLTGKVVLSNKDVNVVEDVIIENILYGSGDCLTSHILKKNY